MVTYQLQLINLDNRNSDVFKQLESNRSSPGQPCCVFVPMASNKATSPINVHPHTHVCASVDKYLGTPRAAAYAHGCAESVYLFVIQKVIVF